MLDNKNIIFIDTLEDLADIAKLAVLARAAMEETSGYTLEGATKEVQDALRVPGVRMGLFKAITAEISKKYPRAKG